MFLAQLPQNIKLNLTSIQIEHLKQSLIFDSVSDSTNGLVADGIADDDEDGSAGVGAGVCAGVDAGAGVGDKLRAGIVLLPNMEGKSKSSKSSVSSSLRKP